MLRQQTGGGGTVTNKLEPNNKLRHALPYDADDHVETNS